MVMYDRREDEWNCVTCGHVGYGEGFAPLDKIDGKGQNREPSHMGSRL